jgi:DNA-binding response OmpR family regulator
MSLIKKRVLIVDDEQSVLDYVVCVLTEHNFECETARNGLEALNRYDAFKPHIIITDIMMPKMDGITLIELLRQKGIMVPCLFITGYEVIREQLEEKCICKSALLIKPFSWKKLIDTLTQLV